MRVTPRGVATALAGVALLIAGWVLGYPELTLIGCAAVFAFVAALLVALRPWSLDVARLVDPVRVMRGEPCRGVLEIRNNARTLGMDLYATDQCAYAVGVVPVPVPIVRLQPRKVSTVHYALPTEQRGVVEVGPLSIERRDIFDLVRTVREYGGTQQVWVHPRAATLQAAPTGAARSLDGVIDKVAYGNITFHALREYVAGDDLRHVHWRTSARVGTLMVREHVDTSVPRIVVLLDDRKDSYAFPQDFESAVEAAASVVLTTLRAHLSIDLHIAAGGTLLSSGQVGEGSEAFLDLLAEVQSQPDAGSSPLADAARRLRHRRTGDTLVVLTGVAGERDLGAIAGLRDMFPSIIVGVMGGDRPGTASEHGLLVMGATTVDEFAAAWDGVHAW